MRQASKDKIILQVRGCAGHRRWGQEVELGYGQVEALLARLHRIADDKRVAFQGRLKHLQRLGFPRQTNTGKGRRVRHSYETLIQLVLALELTQFGLAPQRVVQLVNGGWANCRSVVGLITEQFALEEIDRSKFYLMVRPEALRELTDAGEGRYDYMDAIGISDEHQVLEHLRDEGASYPLLGETWRTAVINATSLVRAAIMLLVYDFRWATETDLIAEVNEWQAEQARPYLTTLELELQAFIREGLDLPSWEVLVEKGVRQALEDARARQVQAGPDTAQAKPSSGESELKRLIDFHELKRRGRLGQIYTATHGPIVFRESDDAEADNGEHPEA